MKRERSNPNIECQKDCPDRSATCHASCDKHRLAWEARRELNEKRQKQYEVSAYQIKEVRKSKNCRGAPHVINNYRPKGDSK